MLTDRKSSEKLLAEYRILFISTWHKSKSTNIYQPFFNLTIIWDNYSHLPLSKSIRMIQSSISLPFQTIQPFRYVRSYTASRTITDFINEQYPLDYYDIKFVRVYLVARGDFAYANAVITTNSRFKKIIDKHNTIIIGGQSHAWYQIDDIIQCFDSWHYLPDCPNNPDIKWSLHAAIDRRWPARALFLAEQSANATTANPGPSTSDFD